MDWMGDAREAIDDRDIQASWWLWMSSGEFGVRW
jgi:hypothetical protein